MDDDLPSAQLGQIQLGFLDDEAIERMAVMEVTAPQCSAARGALYDVRMGSTSRHEACGTCASTYDRCPGHFGFFRLNTEVVPVPGMALLFLKALCHSCGRLLITEEALRGQPSSGRTFAAVHKAATSLSACMHCAMPRPEVKLANHAFCTTFERGGEKFSVELSGLVVKSIFEKAGPGESRTDLRLLRLDPDVFHPRALVLTVFPVLPNQCRMRVCADTTTDADVTLVYKQMIEKSRALAAERDERKRTALIEFLNLRAVTFVDHNKLKQSSKRDFFKVFESVASFLNASETREGKGFIRLKIQGKRTNFNARTVITPDPTLRTSKIRVPRDIAASVTKPERVTPFNVAALQAVLDVQCQRRPGDPALLPFRIQTVEQDGKAYVTGSLDFRLLDGDRVVDAETGEEKERPWLPLTNRDRVLRYGKPLPPRHFHKVLRPGDLVHRTLREGDRVILNRQPTLHRASMQAVEMVLQPPGVKTLSFELSLCSAFNGDFDGDEMNVFVPQSVEAEAELATLMGADALFCSLQSSKTEFPLIQDTVLGAYQMSSRDLDRDEAMHLYAQLLGVVDRPLRSFEALFPQWRGRERDGTTRATALFGALLPDDFDYAFEGVRIAGGRVDPSSVFRAVHLGKHARSLQLLLFHEYGGETALAFTDGAQVLCVEFMTLFPASLSLADCYSQDTGREEEQALEDMRHVVRTVYSKGAFRNAEDAHHRAAAGLDNVMMSFRNRCARRFEEDKKRRGGPANRFDPFVESGSKGDRFNLQQIFIGLGRQHKMFGVARVDGGRRRLVYYPRVIRRPRDRFQAMGFVFSSFFGAATREKPYTGLSPLELLFHAEAGREGVVCKAVKTAQTGYNHRRISKLMENVVVAYDGTVRNGVRNTILQFVYGGDVGYDMSRVTLRGGVYSPVDVPRLAARLNRRGNGVSAGENDAPLRPLADVEALVAEALPLSPHLDGPIREAAVARRRERLRAELAEVRVVDEAAFREELVRRYHRAAVEPGDPIGFNTAASIGESKTQTTLNLFHKSGSHSLSENDAHASFEQLIEMTKSNVKACYTIRFRRAYPTLEALHDALGFDEPGRPLAQVLLRDVVSRWETTSPGSRVPGGGGGCGGGVSLGLNRKACYQHRLSPASLVRALKRTLLSEGESFRLALGPETDWLAYEGPATASAARAPNLDTLLGGLKGLERFQVMRDAATGELYAMAEGDIGHDKLFGQILGHPLVDCRRTRCNHAKVVYDTLGLLESRRVLRESLRHALPKIHETHVQLLVDVMTQQGEPLNFSRYTMRTMDEGVWSHASFEEPMKAILDAAKLNKKDPLRAASASVMWGKRVRLGTGYVEVLPREVPPPPREDLGDGTVDDGDEDLLAEFGRLGYA